MFEVPGATPHDFPPPPRGDEVAARFDRPIYTLIPQPHLIPLDGMSTVGHNDRLVEVSVSYSFLRGGDDPTDPRNFAADIDQVEGWIEKAHRDGQPDWFISSLETRRFPRLGEVVRTSLIGTEAGREVPPAVQLTRHMDHVLINTVEARRRRSAASPAPSLDGPTNPSHARPAVITVDGDERECLIIDTDPDVVGWALAVDDLVVSIVVDRDVAPVLRIELVEGWGGDI